MALREKLKAILVKAETTYAVDPVPTGAADGVLVRSVAITEPVSIKTGERSIVRPFLGGFAQLPAGAFVKIDVEFELAGFGTAGPAAPTKGYDALLRACGLASTITAGTSVVYALVSSGFSSVTCYVYQDGTVHKVVGCFGDASLDISGEGVPVYKITLWGIYVPVADIAFPTVDVSAYQRPVLACADNTTPVSIFGYAGSFKSFSLKFGNDVQTREYPGGVKKVLIVDRKSSGSIELEAVTVATFNPYTLFSGATPGAISVTHGTVAGNIVTIAAGQAVPKNAKFTTDQNLINLGFDFDAIPSAAGNDDFSITVK